MDTLTDLADDLYQELTWAIWDRFQDTKQLDVHNHHLYTAIVLTEHDEIYLRDGHRNYISMFDVDPYTLIKLLTLHVN